jgi:membrane protease YdiL (CAAX protease family)
MKALSPILDAFRGSQRKPTLILLISSPLLLFWRYCCTPEILADLFRPAAAGHAQMVGALAHFVSCLLLFAVLPAAIVKFVFRERLRDYGFGLGNTRLTLRSFLVLGPLFILGGWAAAGDAAVAAKFPVNPAAGQSSALFALHASVYFLFYLGWEFYFRGFLLFGLRDAVGSANAVLIQVLASSLVHIGSPASETFGAILGGILWGVLALRTRSILSGLGQHFLLGVSLDWVLCMES